MSFNQITIVGNVGRDAEIRYTPQGVAVADFSVAVTKITGRGDQRKDKTIWFRVSVWRERAETASQYIKKGMKILVSGELDYSTYVDKAGQTQVSLEITAREFEFLSTRDEMQRMGGDMGGGGGQRMDEQDMYAPVEEPQQRPSGKGRGGRKPAQSEDDIPF